MKGADRFYLDSNTIISMLEYSHALSAAQRSFVEGIDAGRVDAMSSDVALSECLVRPLRDRDAATVDAIFAFLTGRPTFPIASATREIMVTAARLRARTTAKLPDALHLACALEAGCTIFVSADKRLRMPGSMRRVSFDEIELSGGVVE